jgi:hypothetical protein
VENTKAEMTTDAPRLRAIAQLKFKNPKEFLRRIRKYEPIVSLSNLGYRQKTLRTRGLRIHKEQREAALFCYGLQTVIANETLEFAASENSDYDAIFRRVEGEECCYTPIQLKEVVPSSVDPKASLDREIGKLEKYADSKDLVVGIFLNQQGKLQLSRIDAPKVNVGEVWVFGSCSQDQSRWFLFGDVLREPKYVEFEYPR